MEIFRRGSSFSRTGRKGGPGNVILKDQAESQSSATPTASKQKDTTENGPGTTEPKPTVTPNPDLVYCAKCKRDHIIRPGDDSWFGTKPDKRDGLGRQGSLKFL